MGTWMDDTLDGWMMDVRQYVDASITRRCTWMDDTHTQKTSSRTGDGCMVLYMQMIRSMVAPGAVPYGGSVRRISSCSYLGVAPRV